jgi:hypothetical protein
VELNIAVPVVQLQLARLAHTKVLRLELELAKLARMKELRLELELEVLVVGKVELQLRVPMVALPVEVYHDSKPRKSGLVEHTHRSDFRPKRLLWQSPNQKLSMLLRTFPLKKFLFWRNS